MNKNILDIILQLMENSNNFNQMQHNQIIIGDPDNNDNLGNTNDNPDNHALICNFSGFYNLPIDVLVKVMISFDHWNAEGSRRFIICHPRIYQCYLQYQAIIDDHYKHTVISNHIIMADVEEKRISTYYGRKILHSFNDMPATITHDGDKFWCQYWYHYGKQHRELGISPDDLPAVIWNASVLYKEWWVNGERHRGNDLPAIINVDGSQEWWIHGIRHRDGDRPAIIRANGSQEWIINGKGHRDGDRPAIIQADGGQEWWINNQRHRDGDRPAVISGNGQQEWWMNNLQHRISGIPPNDLPAIIKPNGTQEWWVNGLRHRGNDLPAVIKANGTQEWWVNGNPHRDNDLPAVIRSDGTEEWYIDGLRHRNGDLPAIIEINGTEEWWINDDLHRDGDLPAVIRADGTEEWFINGSRHRDNDLPAVIKANGNQEWWIHGKRIRKMKAH